MDVHAGVRDGWSRARAELPLADSVVPEGQAPTAPVHGKQQHGRVRVDGLHEAAPRGWRGQASTAAAAPAPIVASMPMFTFRVRAYAAAHFEFDDVLTVTWPDATAVFQSEYTGGAEGRSYPVTIHGEIRGEGDSLEEAEPRFASTIGNVLPVIALAANAAIAYPLAVAAHGIDLTTPQPFTGYQTPAPGEWFPPGARRIDLDATLALMTAVGGNAHMDLLLRAIEAYRRALTHWIPEERLLAGEFLFIAAETLGQFLIESRAAAKGITPKNLARLHRASGENALRRSFLHDDIFSGDTEALDAMEAASNGFEHGYMSVDDVRGLMDGVLERSMRQVRRTLIQESGVDAASRVRLTGTNYDEPRGLVPVIRWVSGRLAQNDADGPVPQIDGGAIELEWDVKPGRVTTGPDGKVDIEWKPNITLRSLPENTKIEIDSFGLRAAHIILKPGETKAELHRVSDTDRTVESDSAAAGSAADDEGGQPK